MGWSWRFASIRNFTQTREFPMVSPNFRRRPGARRPATATIAQHTSVKIVDEDSEGLDLGNEDVILLKFTVISKESIPSLVGLQKVVREADYVIDQQHKLEAFAEGRHDDAKLGNIRPGRIDTGKIIYENLSDVSVDSVGAGLLDCGFDFVDAHYYVKPGKTVMRWKKVEGEKHKQQIPVQLDDQYVIVLALERRAHNRRIPDELLEIVKGFELPIVWKYCHVYKNRDKATGEKRPATINLVEESENSASCKLVISNEVLLMKQP